VRADGQIQLTLWSVPEIALLVEALRATASAASGAALINVEQAGVRAIRHAARNPEPPPPPHKDAILANTRSSDRPQRARHVTGGRPGGREARGDPHWGNPCRSGAPAVCSTAGWVPAHLASGSADHLLRGEGSTVRVR